MADFLADARRLFPWIPEALLSTFSSAWEKYGSTDLALAELRQSPNYDQFFAGNRRPDGTVRLPEAEYLSTLDAYRTRFASYGLPPNLFASQFKTLVEGDVSPDELGRRLDEVYVGVAAKGDTIRSYYADNFGAGDLSDAALFASAISQQSPLVLEHQIRAAQVGGTARQFGFDRTVQEAQHLADFGLDQAAAQKLYSQAADQLPKFADLVGRFNDPGDPLSAKDFENALVFQDPAALARFARLSSESAAAFSPEGLHRVDNAGRVGGLRQR